MFYAFTFGLFLINAVTLTAADQAAGQGGAVETTSASTSASKVKVKLISPENVNIVPRTRSDQFINELGYALTLLQLEFPERFNNKENADKRRAELINRIIQVIAPEVTYLPQGYPGKLKLKTIEQEASSGDGYKPLEIADGKVVYCRIDSPDKQSVKELQSALKKDKPLIVDLRNAGGLDYVTALKISQELPLQTILLTSEKTCGAGEVLAYLAVNKRKAVSVGSNTAGCSFNDKVIRLPDGAKLLVPDIPEQLKGFVFGAVEAMVPAIPEPLTDYTKLSKDGDIDNDVCLQLAIDLQISLQALSHQ